MNIAISIVGGMLAALLSAPQTLAADIAGGKAKASGCSACHGLNGMATNPAYPNLAGQKDQYLAKALKDYRDGKRKDAMMEGMVKGLNDADIDNIAAYYASLKP